MSIKNDTFAYPVLILGMPWLKENVQLSVLYMEFDYYTDTYVYDSNPKNLGVLDCLNYLKDKLVFTSDSKQEVQDALTRTVERVMDSPIVQAGIKKRSLRQS
ncbi:unnamed protein product [Rhizophagus irregularis]|nr:unnamed protein product [Rhizophagus irregularis]